MYFDTKNKAECCGCTACLNACPTSAITMEEDEEGFYYPHINENTCIHCNLCRKVCSWSNPSFPNNANPITLASILKNKVEREQSTSGGAFYSVARWVISQNGVVFGAAFDEDLQLHHYSAQTITDVQKLRGSKYIQSNLGEIFKEVKKQLLNDRWCFFSGTGCQVAGLKAYLGKEYVKLITADLVCHGVPSQSFFNEHISYLENRYNDKVIAYYFRDNKHGIGCEICEFKNRRKLVNPTYELSPYLYSFMYGMVLRPSCYGCIYAHIPRQGDISLADFWGVGKILPKIERSSGVSLVLLNTDKAMNIWEQVKEDMCYSVSNIDDAIRCNGNLIHSTNKPRLRDYVFKEIKKHGYEYVASHYFRSPNYVEIRIRSILIPLLRPVLKLYRKIMCH